MSREAYVGSPGPVRSWQLASSATKRSAPERARIVDMCATRLRSCLAAPSWGLYACPMPLFDTDKQRAALAVLLLAVGVAIAIAPYATGLLGAPVLYVLFAPRRRWLARMVPPGLAAGVVIVLAFLLIILPGTWLIGMLVGQAQGVAGSLVNSALLARLSRLRVGRLDIGPQPAAIGKELISWLGGNAIGFIGTAARLAPKPIFSFFGPFSPLLEPAGRREGRPALHPVLPGERGEAQGALHLGHRGHGDRHRAYGAGARSDGRYRFPPDRPGRPGVLGRRDDGVRHPPGGGFGDGLGSRGGLAGLRRAHRGRDRARGDRLSRGAGRPRDPPAGHQTVRADPPDDHDRGRDRRGELFRVAGTPPRAAHALLLLRADPDVPGRVSRSVRPMRRGIRAWGWGTDPQPLTLSLMASALSRPPGTRHRRGRAPRRRTP